MENENKNADVAAQIKEATDTAIETKGAEVAKEAADNLNEVKSALENNMALIAKSQDDLTNTVKDFASAQILTKTVKEDQLLTDLKALDMSAVIEGKGTATLDIKTATYGTGTAANVPLEHRVPEIKYEPHHKTRARNIVMTGLTEGDVVRYNQNTSGSNPAAGKDSSAGSSVAFGDYSPVLENKQNKVETYGARITLNEEQLADVLGLRSFITNQLMSFLLDTEDAYILQGAGTSNTFSGIYTDGTAFSASQVIGTTANLYDVITDSAAQLAAKNYNLDCVVLNATDYWHLASIKTTTGQYALRTFDNNIAPKVLGASIYWNNGLTAGRFVAFDKMATQFWMREGATVEFFRNGSDFINNNVTARVKARGCVTNFLPNGIVKGEIATAITDLTS